MNGEQPKQVDVEFAVPFVHRMRFTQDVLGADGEVLLDLLEAADTITPTLSQSERETAPARALFWLDSHVADAQPGLAQKIYALCRKHRQRIELIGNVQIVPGGEEVKNDIHILERMLKVLHAHDLDRRSYVIVIGGGAVLDAVGFAAAIAHRGLRLIRLPTTTLGQADSGRCRRHHHGRSGRSFGASGEACAVNSLLLMISLLQAG